jgi:hypothetical protein
MEDDEDPYEHMFEKVLKGWTVLLNNFFNNFKSDSAKLKLLYSILGYFRDLKSWEALLQDISPKILSCLPLLDTMILREQRPDKLNYIVQNFDLLSVRATLHYMGYENFYSRLVEIFISDNPTPIE